MYATTHVLGRTIRGRVAALAIVTLVGLVAGAVLVSGATAAPGQGSATPFKISYDIGGTRSDCSGAHIVNSNTGMVKDSETCLVSGDTSYLVAGTYSGDPYGAFPGFNRPARWASDYDGAIATHWTVTYVDNGDGTWTRPPSPTTRGGRRPQSHRRAGPRRGPPESQET